MKVIIGSEKEIAEKAAQQYVELLKNKPNAVLGGATGSTPIGLGVIRDVEAPTYDDCVVAQIEEVKAQKKYHNFAELLETNDIWTVE